MISKPRRVHVVLGMKAVVRILEIGSREADSRMAEGWDGRSATGLAAAPLRPSNRFRKPRPHSA
jgi:hypothetical protein